MEDGGAAAWELAEFGGHVALATGDVDFALFNYEATIFHDFVALSLPGFVLGRWLDAGCF